MRVLHDREGLDGRRELGAVMACRLRELLKEHTLLGMELVSVGYIRYLSVFHALGQGFGSVQLNEIDVLERSLLSSGNGDKNWETVTSTPGLGLCEEFGQKGVLLFLTSFGSRMDDPGSINGHGVMLGRAALTFAN